MSFQWYKIVYHGIGNQKKAIKRMLKKQLKKQFKKEQVKTRKSD